MHSFRARASRVFAVFAAATLVSVAALPASAQVGKNLGALDPNLATDAQLSALPGMTPAIVSSIVAGRPYLSMTAFDAALAKALSAEQRKALYPKLFLPINLNNTTDAEIMLVPGVGARMLREFKEYRPFASLAVFRKEIGKYVDAAEEARLEQYVFVPVELNSATDEDILSIPGAGARMVREFKEYRPWKNEAQFKKEIGKYVKEGEVARLWSYVYIKPAG
jgi:DNA uptake protein ComE-like DNA-binding protein